MNWQPEMQPYVARSPVYAFGSFRFDPTRGLLSHGASVVPLPDRLARLLVLLIHANGCVIDKETIAMRVWPECTVSDGNLSQHMYMLRQLLDERARDRAYVMTVRGKGYRFVAPVSVVAPPSIAELTVAADGDADALLGGAPEALHHYCRGAYLIEKRTASALAAAAEQFQAALRVESSYVPALVGLARAHTLMTGYWYAPSSFTLPLAKAAIVRALEIDPSSPEARATLASILLLSDWNWADAEREIETAIRSNPKSGSVFIEAAWIYMLKGSGAQAMRQMQRALLVDPSSPVPQLFLARLFLHAGAYQRAIDAFSNLIETGPDFFIARRHRAQAFILNAQPAEAIADLLQLPHDPAEDIAIRLPLLARAYADCGDTDRALGIYQTLLELARTEYVVGFNLATVAIGLGRLEEALDHLERALARREPALLMLRTLPWFEPIVKRARFKAVLRAVWPFEPTTRGELDYSRVATG